MRTYSLIHLSDTVLLRDLAALVAQDRLTTTALLAHIAEVDARRLYVPAGYPSMHAYCVEELRLSEDAALRRIQAARAGRLFPVLFTALAEGRLHLTAACLLAPHLTPENVGELVEAAAHRRKSEIGEMLVRRFGMPEVSGTVCAIVPIPHTGTSVCATEHAPAHVDRESLLLAGAWSESMRWRKLMTRVPSRFRPSASSSSSPLEEPCTTSCATPRPC